MRVTIYTKPGCHLCEDTLSILDRLTPQYNLEVNEVNILDDMALYDEFHAEIPVLDLEDGRLGRLKAPIDEASLRMAFDIAGRASGPPRSGGGGSRNVPPPPYKEALIDRVARYVGLHWLRLAVIAMSVYVGLPWLAPIFAALGLWDIANPIYTAYAFTCHQLPERAGDVLGYQVAFCYRNTALYGGVALWGALYALARDHNVRPLQWLRTRLPVWALILLALPMTIDGVTHMLGIRDTPMDASFGSFYIGSQPGSLNWWLRIITGLMAALAIVWFAAPRMDKVVAESESLRIIYGAVGQVQPQQAL